MADSPKKRQPARLAGLQEHTRLIIESEFRRLKAENLNGRDLRTCYCEGLRKIREILYPTGAGLDEPAIDNLVELTFEAANRIGLRQPNLLTRGFGADVMGANASLRQTSHPFDRPMPPERPHEQLPHSLEAQSPLSHRRETFGGVEVPEGTQEAFTKYLQAEIERLRADNLKLRATKARRDVAEVPAGTRGKQAEADRAARRQAVVKPILERKRWTRGRLVTESGVGKATVYGYLDGTRSWINKENRKAIAESLGLKPEKLPC